MQSRNTLLHEGMDTPVQTDPETHESRTQGTPSL